jgi:hypothetical protein
MSARASSIRVGLEEGKRRTFAVALDWPGWARSGKTPDDALETLAAYAPRYAVVAATAGYPLSVSDREPASLVGRRLKVVEREAGKATTDFGAPAVQFEADGAAMSGEEVSRMTAILEASWDYLERVAAGARAELRKGPRGGGRDRDQIVDHVVAAEVEYARKLGVPRPKIAPGAREAPGAGEAAALLRSEILGALEAAARGEGGSTAWKPRYAARRLAWHVLDHAFEIEDRSDDN